MLTTVEKLLFILLSLLATGAAYTAFIDIYRIINRGERELYLDNLPARLWTALITYLTQRTTLKTRKLTSLIHLGVVWGFSYYFLVNLIDGLEGFIPGFRFFDDNLIGGIYRLIGDVLSVIVLAGVGYFIARRVFLPNRRDLQYHDNILLHPKVAAGAVNQDSFIVASFILLHIGARFLGQAARISVEGADVFSPFATLISPIFASINLHNIVILEHIFWWVALGGILLFLPYFAQSKHIHLAMAPLNFLTRPRRTSLGEMDALDFEDEDREQFGANKIEHLAKTNIFDSFACIMCNRCQDVCPAYVTGKELSPSAYEINKRYMIKDQQSALAAGAESVNPLLGFALSESALWACTSCAACIEICPVGNEPMIDILDIRRDSVLMQGEFPNELKTAFNGMERQGNPWQSTESRMRWANGLDVPTVDENPDYDVLYWTGCAVAYDPRAQLTARALVKVLRKAGINFAVLGDSETCTGDVARRAGKEDTYVELAMQNVETLNEAKPKRIVVTCPHCFQNIGKEYHQFGGDYEVVHHTELIDELIAQGKIPESAHPNKQSNVTFHDPCYLGRYNDVIDEPRDVLANIGANVIEMPRNRKNSFCCGAGGAQFWKEEEHGAKAVNVERYQEAKATGADTLAVGCPFCMQMFETAQASVEGGPVVKDIVELVADSLN